ncbi:MAG TPA: diaminopimelate decarboxylase [Erysipelotrichaceae bacterium]|nr:diaminopimelate decarboxylase [Erysipelotrichaceae bacterium]
MTSCTEIREIAERYGTPSFVFDLEILTERFAEMRKIADGRYHLCYSIKANPFLVPCMNEIADNLEVCSPGELAICKSLHVHPEKIIYSGVNKGEKDVTEAFAYGVCTFTAESVNQFHLISRIAEQMDKKVSVLLRLTSGTQFGMSEEDLLSLIEQREAHPYAQIDGIHFFAGTQQKKPEKKKKELAVLKALFEKIRSGYGMELKKLEYGPGFPVPVFEDDDFSDTLKPMKEFHETLKETAGWADLTIETGRFISAECGTYITRAADLKSSYCILDGGINHVSYIGQMMGMKVPVIRHLKTTDNTDKKEWILCGSLCTVNDVLVRKKELEGLSVGDILAFDHIGAYSVTEGIYLFLSRTMPSVILRENKNSFRLVRNPLETSELNTPVI